MHKVATAKKLMEIAEPKINKILNDGIAEREMDEVMKIVELAHYLCELELMEGKIYPHEEMDMGRNKRIE